MSPWLESSAHLLPVGRRSGLSVFLRTWALAAVVLVAGVTNRTAASEIADFGNDFHPTMSPDGTRIAFYTYRTGLPDILVVDSHGQLVKNLSDSPDTWDIQPVWSPNGKLIAWSSGANMGELGVRIAREDGELVSDGVRIEGRRTFFGGWSPDSKQIVVSVDDPETRQFAIYVCALDGSAATRVTKAPGSWTAPTFSPDGKTIAAGWKPDRDSESRIQIMRTDGTGVRTLSTAGSATSPAYSPDGKTLVYVSERDGNPELYAIDLTTEVERRLTTSDDPDRFPRFSFDGRSILWCSEANGTSDIWTMDVRGTHLRNLTQSSCWSRCARLSPDGQQMVFESKRDGHSQIYVSDPDGENARALCAGPHTDSTPTWSPNGDWIAFTRKLEDGLDVFICSTDGSGLRNVTNSPGDDANPDVSPSGEWIAFDSTRDEDGAAEIYRVRVDG
ncbi:MAG: PD40 domain-containing protein, partial [Candidatus Eisenbacteria bacterium]|nr:PD40 domain-containing protein [Candidatus Eisenbacteria bacterium]